MYTDKFMQVYFSSHRPFIHSSLSLFPVSSQPLAHSILLATLQRLIATCEVSHSWCSTKSHSLLTQRALSSFLLVTQSDLKVNIDMHFIIYFKS